MRWWPVSPSSPDLLRLRGAHDLQRHDPLMVWADLTKFRGFGGLFPPSVPADEQLLPLAVELDSPLRLDTFDHVLGRLNGDGPYIGERFCALRVPAGKLLAFAEHAGVLRYKLGLPAIPEQASGAFDVGMPTKAKLVLASIDHGFAFANHAFRVGDQSRIAALWDQDPNCLERNRLLPLSERWKAPSGFDYGGVLDESAITALMRRHPDEARLYRHISYEPVQGRISHGTHVLDLAAGTPNPLQRIPGSLWHSNRKFAGAADAVEIVAVQLPSKPAKDTSGTSLCVHVLDALHYVRGKVGKTPVVVNLSDGAYAGPHDGMSLLESAIDDFVSKHSNFHVVVAAGNGFEERGHVRATVAKSGRLPLRWRVLPDDVTDSFLEIWPAPDVRQGEFEIHVRAPGGASAQRVKQGESFAYGPRDPDDTPVCAVLSASAQTLPRRRSMMLVALAPTRPRNAICPAAPHGVWEIEVHNTGERSITFDAWIERDNPALGDIGPRRQSYFIDDREVPGCVDRGRTLNSVATGAATYVVGGYYGRGTFFHDHDIAHATSVSRYSSSGPGRALDLLDGPDLGAPADESPILHGLCATGNRSGTVFRMDGTSVAAPLVTRRIANLLGKAGGSMTKPAVLKALKTPGAPASVDPLRDGDFRIVPGMEP